MRYAWGRRYDNLVWKQSAMMDLQRIYLTGYRGTGKSTVGKQLAKLLHTQCLDLDRRIEVSSGKSIKMLFDEGGEELFRQWEHDCLREVASAEVAAVPLVVALGGGAIIRSENRELIKQSGVCVWLQSSVETIAQRILGRGYAKAAKLNQPKSAHRPALTDLEPVQEIVELLKVRDPLYEEVSSSTARTDRQSPRHVALEIFGWYHDLSTSG